MFRRALIVTGLALWAMGPVPAMAQSAQDSVVAQLQAQGFGNIEIERTLLGRLRITSQSAQLSREIVLNPATGEILRDYWEPLESGVRSQPVLRDPGDDDRSAGGQSPDEADDSGQSGISHDDDNSGDSGGRDDADDDDDDDGRDDDDDDDEDDDD